MTNEVVAALAGAGVGAGLAFAGLCLTDWLRERRERKSNTRDFAAALVAEVNGWLSWWQQVNGTCVWDKEGKPLGCIGMTGTESLFSVFDNAGPRLSWLPHDVAKETVVCYAEMKSIMNSLQGVAEALLYEALAGKHSSGQVDLGNTARGRARKILGTAEEGGKGKEVQGLVKRLVEKLER